VFNTPPAIAAVPLMKLRGERPSVDRRRLRVASASVTPGDSRAMSETEPVRGRTNRCRTVRARAPAAPTGQRGREALPRGHAATPTP
jgi:hypothetical protein